MSPPRVLLVQPGSTLPEIEREHGDFDAWFARALSSEPIAWTRTRPHLGEPLPEAGGFDAVIVTGSPASVARPEPWMAPLERFVRETVESDLPLLGVCFGHQLLARAFGARVVRNPGGPERGTCEVELTAEGREDPLFEGLAERFRVQQTHEDAVVDPPGAVRVLARSAKVGIQAIAVGPRARGVQFHPEMSHEAMAAYARVTSSRLAAEPTPAGPQLLRTFLRRVAAR